MTALSAAQCSLLSLHQSHINHKEKTPLMETLGKMSHMNYSSWQDASILNQESTQTCHLLKKSTYVCGLWVTNVIWYAVNSPNFVQTVSKSPLENLALNKQTLIFNSSLQANIFHRLIEYGLGRLLVLVIAFIATDQTSSSLTKPEQNIYYRSYKCKRHRWKYNRRLLDPDLSSCWSLALTLYSDSWFQSLTKIVM